MKRNCKNCYCFYNSNNQCMLEKNCVSEMGLCKGMLVLNKQINNKIYKFKLVN